MPYPVRPSTQYGPKSEANPDYRGHRQPVELRYFTGLWTLVLGVLMATGPAAASDIASSVVYEAEGIRATAYADCDTSGYALVRSTEPGTAERYAASDKFAAKVEPHLTAILDASTMWLDGDGRALCDNGAQAETIALIGVVNALPVYVSAASRAAGWQPGSAIANARDMSTFESVLPPVETVSCGKFEETAGAKISKYRTRIFTIRAAHTTGQWSHMQALTKLVPLHQEIMGMVGDWSFEWQCADVFELAGIAILADEERAVLLKWNQEKIRERLAEATTPDEVTSVMVETYRMPGLPPVSSLHEIVQQTDSGAVLRYGGFLSPDVEQMEAIFVSAGG